MLQQQTSYFNFLASTPLFMMDYCYREDIFDLFTFVILITPSLKLKFLTNIYSGFFRHFFLNDHRLEDRWIC